MSACYCQGCGSKVERSETMTVGGRRLCAKCVRREVKSS